jgi:RHS repeat-associated protein
VFTYDEQNRERTRSLPGVGTTSITYDPAGNVDSATDSGGTVTYGYDDANQLTSVTEPGGAKTTFAYDKNGKRTRTTFPGGTTQTVIPDDSNRPTEIEVKSGTSTLSSLSYDYSSGGKDTDEIRKRTADGVVTAYAYDTLGRLTKAVETKNGTTTAGWAYCYDRAGNRTASSTGTSLPACDSAQHTYTYNDAGQLTAYDSKTGFTYDGDGNETSADSPTGTRTDATWTPFTQLASYAQSGTTTDHTYAGTDNTQRLTRGDTTFTNAAVGLTGQSVSGTATGFVREPSGALVAMRSGGSSQYYLTDAQNSVIGLVDTAGKRTATYTYGPYGEPRTHTGTQQPYRYTGAYLDPSGLYKMGARYYDPALGHFTQPDPSGQENNAYLYAGADPVNHSDPTGLFLNSVVDAVSTGLSLKDAAGALEHYAARDTEALLGDLASVAAGSAGEFACYFVAGFVAAPTAGVGGAAVAAGCTAVGFAAGFGTEQLTG